MLILDATLSGKKFRAFGSLHSANENDIYSDNDLDNECLVKVSSLASNKLTCPTCKSEKQLVCW